MRRFALLLVLICFAMPVFAQEGEQTPYEIALQRIQEAEASGATYLNLSRLGLSELPSEIGNLGTLQNLDLGFNQLSSLPPEIGNLGNLEMFMLDDNELTVLPPEIGSLTNLRFILLTNNELQSLPPEIGNLSNLYTLWLHGNQLTSLPPEISRLQNLCNLFLSDNQFQVLPLELSQMEGLRGEDCWLQVTDNPLISPPQEVIEQETAAILDYLENEALWHIQRLIIGAATGFGLVAAFILGMRWRNRDKRKRKNNL